MRLRRIFVAAVLRQVLHLVLLGPDRFSRIVMVFVARRRLVALIAAVFLMTFVFHCELFPENRVSRSRHSKHTIFQTSGTSVRLHRSLRFFCIKTISIFYGNNKSDKCGHRMVFLLSRRFPVAMLRTHRDSRVHFKNRKKKMNSFPISLC